MADAFLMNTVRGTFGTLYAGTLVDDASDLAVGVLAAGGQLTLATNATVAAAAPLALQRRSAPDEAAQIMSAALNAAQDGAELATFENGLSSDTVAELTGAAGVTVDGVLLKDGAVSTDTINEDTPAAGVTIDGVLLKDGAVTTDTIIEDTPAAGVTIDGVLLKDGELGLAPGITSIQVAGGTFVAGTATIAAGITVTADTDAFIIMSAVITGSTNIGGVAHLKASNTPGVPGVGDVTLNVLTDAGVLDTDAAGAFRVLLIN